MPRTLLLHVGPHKTGTTAIQKALTEARPALARLGWSYPEIGFDYYGHHLFAEALTAPRAAELPAMVEALAAVPWNLVLSSENFSHVDAAGWQRLRDLLADRFTLRLVFVLRSPLSRLFSAWQEAVKHGGSETLPEYLLCQVAAPFASPVLNPTACLEALEAGFGREAIEIHSYEQAVAAEGGLVRHFFVEVMGLTPPVDPRTYDQVNKTFGTVQVELIRVLSRAGLPAVQLMLEDAGLRALAQEIEARMSVYLRVVHLRMDSFALAAPEQLLENWRDRFRFTAPSGHVHSQRAQSYEILDPAIWVLERDLAARLAELIARH